MTLTEFIEAYLRKLKRRINPKADQIGRESEWLSVGSIDLIGSGLALADVQFLPYEDHRVIVELSPSEYQVHVRLLEFGADVRLSRLRMSRQEGSITLGQQLAETWVDTGVFAVCDAERLDKAEPLAEEASAWSELVDAVSEIDLIGGAEFEGVDIAVMTPGFGDGEYPVWELVQNGERVGFEIEFIASDQPYPF